MEEVRNYLVDIMFRFSFGRVPHMSLLMKLAVHEICGDALK